MGGDSTHVKPARITHVASSVGRGIAVQQFAVVAGTGYPDSIGERGTGVKLHTHIHTQ